MLRLAFLSLLLTTTSLEAQQTDSHRSFCETKGKAAGSLMELRQMGVPPSEILGVTDPGAYSFIKPIILQAYEYPRFSSDEVIQEAIQEFRIKIEVECLDRQVSN